MSKQEFGRICNGQGQPVTNRQPLAILRQWLPTFPASHYITVEVPKD